MSTKARQKLLGRLELILEQFVESVREKVKLLVDIFGNIKKVIKMSMSRKIIFLDID